MRAYAGKTNLHLDVHKTFIRSCSTALPLGKKCFVCKQKMGGKDEYLEHTIRYIGGSKIGDLAFHKDPACFNEGADILARQLRGDGDKYALVETNAGGCDYEYHMMLNEYGKMILLYMIVRHDGKKEAEPTTLKFLRQFYDTDELIFLGTSYTMEKSHYFMLAHVSDRIFSSHFNAENYKRDKIRQEEVWQDLQIRGEVELEEVKILAEFALQCMGIIADKSGQ
ncbi:hypothetical protein CENSYa_0162 [Cenarchaeum symbiosum A]|uniref:Uncharacterized protein n=1 Tax=Cenarchaeum symbiosum (strain A) TaxID=414004 RepID=A0RTZ0_CENSY|nr:hypothetical protein CENSYa_0162 [Cenarchaeum symbiosum A]